MSDPEAPVGNPLRAELDDLVRRVRSATEQVPAMRSPVAAVGDGDAWSGPAARRFRDNHLEPVRSDLYGPLDRLIADVESRRDGLAREVSPEQAESLRREWGLW